MDFKKRTHSIGVKPRFIICRGNEVYFEASDCAGFPVWTPHPFDACSWKFKEHAIAYARKIGQLNLTVLARFACVDVPPEASRR